MKKVIIFTLAWACVPFSLAFAEDANPEELLVEKKCTPCHSVDHDMGKAPSFKAIANKYNKSFEPLLVQRVKSGSVDGGHHWGIAPMPGAGARPEVSEAEARELVAYILSLK